MFLQQYKHSPAQIKRRYSSEVNLAHPSCIGSSLVGGTEDGGVRLDYVGICLEEREKEEAEVWAAGSQHHSLRQFSKEMLRETRVFRMWG